MTTHRQQIDAFNARSDSMRKDEHEFNIAILRALRLNLATARKVDELIFGEGER